MIEQTKKTERKHPAKVKYSGKGFRLATKKIPEVNTPVALKGKKPCFSANSIWYSVFPIFQRPHGVQLTIFTAPLLAFVCNRTSCITPFLLSWAASTNASASVTPLSAALHHRQGCHQRPHRALQGPFAKVVSDSALPQEQSNRWMSDVLQRGTDPALSGYMPVLVDLSVAEAVIIARNNARIG